MNIEINEIDNKIAELQKKKYELLKKIRETTLTSKEKLALWESLDKGQVSDLFQCQQYPNLYKKIKKHDYERYRTIELEYMLEEMFIRIDNGEETEEDIKILDEIMNNNIGSVVYDW